MSKDATPRSSKRINRVYNLFFGKAEKTEEESAFVAETQFKPFNPDDLYQKAGSHDIYKDMLKDDQVSVAVQLKKDLVLGSGFNIVSKEEGQEDIVKDLEQAFGDDQSVSLVEQLEEVLSAYEFGFSLTEKIFRTRDDGSLTLKILKTRDPDTWLIHTDKHGNIKKYEQQGVSQNLDIKIETLIHYINNRKFQNAYGRSDLRAAYYAYFTKRHIIRFYSIFLEKAASPTPVGRYKKNTPDATVQSIFDIIKKFQARTAMMIPEDVQVEFLESKSNGEAYIKGINIFNMFIGRSMFIPDLIGIQGSDTEGGARSLGTDQIKIFMNHIKKRRTVLENLVNSHLIKPIVVFNHGFIDNMPKFVLKPVSDEEAMGFAKIFIEAVKGKLYKPSEAEINHLRDIIKFPQGEVEFAAAPSAPAPPPTPPPTGTKLAEDDDEIEEEETEVSVLGSGHEEENKAFKKLVSSYSKKDLDKLFDLYYQKKVNFQTSVFAPTEGDFGDKVNFQAISNKMEENKDNIVEQSKPIIDTIFADLADQIERKKIIQNDRPDKIEEIKLRNLKKFRLVLKENFKRLFNDAQTLADNELNRSDFQAPILTEEFLKFLDTETFKFIGDWEFNVTRQAKDGMISAIKDGKPLSSVIDLLDTEVKKSSLVSLERFARTKGTEVLNKGRLATFDKSGIVTGYQYSAVLDDRTTTICAGLHNKQFRKGTEPIPPLHFNCRSVLIPITRFEKLNPDTTVGGTVKTRRGDDIKVPRKNIEVFIDQFKGKGFPKR